MTYYNNELNVNGAGNEDSNIYGHAESYTIVTIILF
jgi:hypothetical protein